MIIDINISNTILVAHANITVSFFKLDTRPIHSDIVFPNLLHILPKEWNAASTVKHNFKQLGRIISKKRKQISDRTLVDKPPCALA